MIKITDLNVPLNYTVEMLKSIAAKRLKIDASSIESLRIAYRAVDESDKQNIHFNMSVVVCVFGDEDVLTASSADQCVSKEMKYVYSAVKKKR